jgi:hypothetical protein
VLAQPVIFLPVFFKHLFVVAFEPAINFNYFAFVLKMTLKHKKTFIVPDVLAIGRVKKTFAKREVMDSIQNIGFALTIITGKTIYMATEIQFSFCIIFKI